MSFAIHRCCRRSRLNPLNLYKLSTALWLLPAANGVAAAEATVPAVPLGVTMVANSGGVALLDRLLH